MAKTDVALNGLAERLTAGNQIGNEEIAAALIEMGGKLDKGFAGVRNIMFARAGGPPKKTKGRV